VCVVVGRRVIAPARVTSGCGARRRHGAGFMLADRPDAFRANSTSSERRLTRVVSPRPVYGDALASSGTLAQRSGTRLGGFRR
jgi:hypothetical protein